MRVVKSFVREDYETEKFTAASDDVRKDFLKAEKILATNTPLMQFCVYMSRILICYFAAKLIVQSGGTYLNVGSLTSMMTYTISILMSLMMLSMIFVMVTMASASAKRIAEVWTPSPTSRIPPPCPREVPNGAVDFDHVSFKYSAKAERNALDDIDLHIPRARPSASSAAPARRRRASSSSSPASTTRPKAASAWAAMTCANTTSRRCGIRWPWCCRRTCSSPARSKENLRWGDPDATDEDLVRVCRLAQADDFVRAFPDGYDTYIEQGGTNVSGGQKQRLCIARALLKKPKVLILDDSTSAVDTKTDALIRQAFATEIPETTKIIIAQRIASVQDADLIVVMENGRIDGLGTHKALLQSNQIYREVYESQTRGGADDGE